MDVPSNILIVDDDPDICDILKQFLETMGCAPDVVLSANDALDAVGRKDYDVAIVDLQLGDRSGLEVLSRIKRDQPRAEVIMVSGYGRVQDVSEAIGLGASAYIQKPITFAQVDLRLKEALAKRLFVAHSDQIISGASESNPELKAHLEQVSELCELGKQLVATMDPRRIIDAVLTGLIKVVRCECAYLFLAEDGGAALYVYSESPVAEEVLQAVREDARAVWRKLRRDEVPQDRIQIFSEHRLGGEGPPAPSSVGGAIRVPLSGQDKVVGLLCVWHPTAGRAESEDVECFPYVLGSLAALALDTAFLHHHTRTLALTDGLTGLLNYRAFLDRLKQEFDRSRRYSSLLSLLMLDIDLFKSVNDTHGHQQGDFVLAEVARILRRSSRESDILGRYGGEEFVVLLPEANASQAHSTAERIRKEIAKHPFQLPHCTLSLTVSLGVATWPHPHIRGPEDLIEHADRALYRSKGQGRNRTTLVEEVL